MLPYTIMHKNNLYSLYSDKIGLLQQKKNKTKLV